MSEELKPLSDDELRIAELPENLRRLAKWARFNHPNSTIWLHAIEAAEYLEALARIPITPERASDAELVERVARAIYAHDPLIQRPDSPDGNRLLAWDDVEKVFKQKTRSLARAAIAALQPQERSGAATPTDELEICGRCMGSGTSGPDQTCMMCNGTGGTPITPEGASDAELVERVANVLWHHLDLNGHTGDGVRRTAAAVLAALQPQERSNG